MDTRVFLNHLFKLCVETIEELSKNTVPQRIPPKALAEVMEMSRLTLAAMMASHTSFDPKIFQLLREYLKEKEVATTRKIPAIIELPAWLEPALDAPNDIFKRSREYFFLHAIHDLPVMEKPPASRIIRVMEDPTNIFDPFRAARNLAKRLSLTRDQFVHAFSTFYSAGVASGQLREKVGPRLYKLDITESELQSFLQARHANIALDVLSPYNERENSATDAPSPDKEVGTPPTEGEPQQGVESAKPQALQELRDSAGEKLKSSKDTSDVFNIPLSVAVSLAPDIHKASQKGVSHEEIEQALQQTAQTLQKEGVVFSHRAKLEEAVQPPDLHEIAPWKSKEKSGPASKYLQDKYGHLLRRYNRELDRDLICLQDIKAHDKTLWQGLYSESKKTGIKPSEYIASKSQRTKEAALGTDIDKVRELEREAARQRQAMRRHGISLESLKNKP